MPDCYCPPPNCHHDLENLEGKQHNAGRKIKRVAFAGILLSTLWPLAGWISALLQIAARCPIYPKKSTH
ncbi:hypothetical protein P692DRAFT_20825273 [Suillus brevipes Sb2]|nr:hypothetical protein P692DRAFT_20825273 [Suillus brevipes Sb2]